MSSPCIGITTGREVIGGRRFDALPHEYIAAVLAAGGLPRPIPPLPADLASGALDGVDGLVLSGGGDINPLRYGAAPAIETGNVDDERDVSELALVPVALERRLPVLGICRGAQLLNVALGGSLIQHLPDRAIGHLDRGRRHETVHDVALRPDSLLARLGGLAGIEVNSIHHQAIDRVGDGLRITGTADDGVPEVLEGTTCPLVAVQWHPECLPTLASSRLLFTWLVEQARQPTPGGGLATPAPEG